MSLSADKATPLRPRTGTFADPVAATQSIYVGGLVMLNTSGNLVKAAATATLIMRGVAKQQSVNAAAGAIVESEHGVLVRLKNSASSDQITRAEIGDTCYVVDDETVAKTDNSSARPAAGTVKDIDADTGEVWVEIA